MHKALVSVVRYTTGISNQIFENKIYKMPRIQKCYSNFTTKISQEKGT